MLDAVVFLVGPLVKSFQNNRNEHVEEDYGDDEHERSEVDDRKSVTAACGCPTVVLRITLEEDGALPPCIVHEFVPGFASRAPK